MAARRGPSEKSLANLKPGSGSTTAATEEKRRRSAVDDNIRSAQDPDKVILELFQEAALAATRGLRQLNRIETRRAEAQQEGDTTTEERVREASRQLIETVRETRQLATVAGDILKARGSSAEATEFFAEMEARFTEANLGEGLVPIHCAGCGGAV